MTNRKECCGEKRAFDYGGKAASTQDDSARCARLRVGKVLIDLPDFRSARRISYRLGRFSQNSGEVPKK